MKNKNKILNSEFLRIIPLGLLFAGVSSCTVSQPMARETDGIYYDPSVDVREVAVYDSDGDEDIYYDARYYNQKSSKDDLVRIGGKYFDENGNAPISDYRTDWQRKDRKPNSNYSTWGDVDKDVNVSINYFGSPYYSGFGWGLGFGMGYNWYSPRFYGGYYPYSYFNNYWGWNDPFYGGYGYYAPYYGYYNMWAPYSPYYYNRYYGYYSPYYYGNGYYNGYYAPYYVKPVPVKRGSVMGNNATIAPRRAINNNAYNNGAYRNNNSSYDNSRSALRVRNNQTRGSVYNQPNNRSYDRSARTSDNRSTVPARRARVNYDSPRSNSSWNNNSSWGNSNSNWGGSRGSYSSPARSGGSGRVFK
ncbi:hypothetical protein EDM00_01450 [Ornithobacterium rhinotracheale]|uniref:hypothetical protein n=1 Tax=Ornithobacterium rhinotracheale TaxID=28251 RepID=UPI00129C7B11|nr:hypothetical protein [Ornithobacterium rhinotracheale]MRI62667.1 hypothetical protein [Ornithobacterium rhinotracheale]